MRVPIGTYAKRNNALKESQSRYLLTEDCGIRNYLFPALFIRLATSPAPNPLPTFTAVKLDKLELSIPESSAPSPESSPPLTFVGTRITGISSLSPISESTACSFSAAKTITRDLSSNFLSLGRMVLPFQILRTMLPIVSAVRAATSAMGISSAVAATMAISPEPRSLRSRSTRIRRADSCHSASV